MAGTKNDVIVAKNADFTQAGAPNASSSESNGLITDGQLWIGSTALNAGSTHVNVGSLTSPDSSITIGYSTPNITIIANDAMTGQTITGNTGGPISPVGGNWNIVGTSTNGIQTAGAGDTLTTRMQSPYADADFSFESQTGGTTRTLTVQNTVDAASSQATNLISVAGGSSGDVWTQWSVGSTTSWGIGVDNSDTDALVLRKNDSGTVNPSTGTVYWRNYKTPSFGVTPYTEFRGNYNLFQDTIVGAPLGLFVSNQDNTNAASDAQFSVRVGSGGGGASSGNPCIGGVIETVTAWGAILDNADSDILKLQIGAGAQSTINSGQIFQQVTQAREVTFPGTPAFLAYNAAADTNATGDATVVTLPCDTEVFDQGGDYNTGTFTFTAPVTGRYYFNVSTQISNVTAGHTDAQLSIVTSNRNYFSGYNNAFAVGVGGTPNSTVYNASAFADMDASDTMTATITVTGSTKTVTVQGNSPNPNTWISGFLQC